MSGAEFGGAEFFFERLAASFDKRKIIDQKVIIKSDKKRLNTLKKKIKDIEGIKLFRFYNPLCLMKIENSIEKFEPNIVFTWMNRASSLLPNKKIRNEVTVGRLGGFYKIKNYAKCDYLITNTTELKKYVIKQGWDEKKVEFIPNFVSKNNNTKMKIKFNKEKLLLCMGRFHDNKAIDILIKSMPFLPDFKLWLVGNGPLKEIYESLIKKYNLDNRVRIFDWSNDISEFLNTASLLICPSRHEPFGNIIIDGWAHKIPVIVSNTGGPGILVKHKVNGLKFETENTFDLVQKIKDLSSDLKLRKKIVSNGYSAYKKSYSEDVIVKKYINFFKRITT